MWDGSGKEHSWQDEVQGREVRMRLETRAAGVVGGDR